MRDKNRIPAFLSELQKCWEKVPDWRFGQFISNVLGTCKKDPFFYEEEEMIKLIKDYFNNYKLFL